MSYSKKQLTRNAPFNIQAFRRMTPAQQATYRRARKAGLTPAQAMADARKGSPSPKAREQRALKRGQRKAPAFNIRAFNSLNSAQKAQYKKLRASGLSATAALSQARDHRGPTVAVSYKPTTSGRRAISLPVRRKAKKKDAKKKAAKKKAAKKRASKKATSSAPRRKRAKVSTSAGCFSKSDLREMQSKLESIIKKLEARPGDTMEIEERKAKARATVRRQWAEIKSAAACRLGQQRAISAGQTLRKKCPVPPRSAFGKSGAGAAMGYQRARKAKEKTPSAKALANKFLRT
jgi:hypothetical protein